MGRSSLEEKWLRGWNANRAIVSSEAFTVKAAVFTFLRDARATTIFGNPGSTELRFLRDWPSDFRYVMSLHEGCAVAMADAYAQLCGNAAIVNLHSAGGLGNALGSIFSAFKNQAPLVITAGQQTRAMFPTVPFLYAQDATTFPKPYVKWACEPARAQDVPAAIAQAYYFAMQPPYGPTFVSIPEDDWDVETDPVPPRTIEARFVAGEASLERLFVAFERSARPALVVGPEVDRDGACDAAVALAERTGAAVFVAPLSGRCSFPERHPNFVGFLPPVRTDIVRKLRDFDLVVVLGAPIFTYHVFTPGPPITAGTNVIHLTSDPSAAATAVVGTSILTTMREPLEALVRRLSVATAKPPARTPSVSRRERVADVAATDPPTGAYALQTLARMMPDDAIVVEEAPSHRAALHVHLPIGRPGAFFAAASGSLGWALPAAIGAALARPGRRIVAILGDGSSMYAIQALWNAAHLILPITFVILNNGSYAAMAQFGEYLGFSGSPSFALPGLDFVRAAEAFGVPGVRARRAEELAPALAASFARRGPTLIDVEIRDGTAAIY